MLNFLRTFLIATLCGLSLLSSSGVSEALHDNLHALMASACPNVVGAEASAAAVAPPSDRPAITAVAAPCPLQLILQSSLSQALILPTVLPTATPLVFISLFQFHFESKDIASWTANWAFSRGPPILA